MSIVCPSQYLSVDYTERLAQPGILTKDDTRHHHPERRRAGRLGRLVDVAAWLRCSRCGERPAVVLVDDTRGAGETGSRIYGRARRVPVPGADRAGPSIPMQP